MVKAQGKGKRVDEDTCTVTEARKDFAELVNRVVYQGRRITLIRRNKPIAVLIPADDAA